MDEIKVVLTGECLTGLTRDLMEAARKLVTKAAFDIEAEWKRNITIQNAIDTGAYRASIYASVPGRGSGYSRAAEQAVSEARKGTVKLRRAKKATPKGVDLLPELAAVQEYGCYTAIVSSAVEYAFWVEYGTRLMPARPCATPAKEKIEREFRKAAAELGKSLK